MRRKVEQEGYLQEPSKASQTPVATSFQKNNHLMGFAHASSPSQLSPTGQSSVNSEYPYYHISEAQNVSHSQEHRGRKEVMSVRVIKILYSLCFAWSQTAFS